MIGFILFVVGVALGVKAILEIFDMNISFAGKIICTVLILLTSWLGLAIYYLYAKHHLTEWFK